MTTFAASMVENMVKALDGTPAEEPEPTKAKATQEPLVELFYRAMRGETHYTKDLTRHWHVDPVGDFIAELKRVGAV